MKLMDKIIDLNLTVGQLEDKEIQEFVIQSALREKSGNWIQYWNGNGYIEINKINGTSIRTILDDKPYVAEFPENIDMEISNKCTNGCSFCYANCTPEGKDADINKFIEDKNSFLYSLQPGTELALNGNEPLHPQLFNLLNFCKERQILANLTVHENTLIKNRHLLEFWLDSRYINGIGISPCSYSEEMINFCKAHPTSVIHTIAGITSPIEFNLLKDNSLKILILGYKTFGKGEEYKGKFSKKIEENILWLKDNLSSFQNNFEVISLDNLAIIQLQPETWLPKDTYSKIYRGDDGSHTFFIDLVNETYALNSMQSKENHEYLLSDVKDMLKNIQSKRK